MPRRTPVREIQDDKAATVSSPLRRSTRVTASPIPTKQISSRRNSASEPTTSTPTATRSRRSSFSQEPTSQDNADSATENGVGKPKTKRSSSKESQDTSNVTTRSRRRSVDLENGEAQDTKVNTRSRRRSVDLENGEAQGAKLSTRSRQKSAERENLEPEAVDDSEMSSSDQQVKVPFNKNTVERLDPIDESSDELDSSRTVSKKKKAEVTKIDMDLSVIDETSFTEEDTSQKKVEVDVVALSPGGVECDKKTTEGSTSETSFYLQLSPPTDVEKNAEPIDGSPSNNKENLKPQEDCEPMDVDITFDMSSPPVKAPKRKSDVEKNADLCTEMSTFLEEQTNDLAVKPPKQLREIQLAEEKVQVVPVVVAVQKNEEFEPDLELKKKFEEKISTKSPEMTNELEDSGAKKHIPEERREKNAALESEVIKSPEVIEELEDSGIKKHIPEEEERQKTKTAAIKSDRKIEQLDVSGTKKHIPEEAPKKNAAIESGVRKSPGMVEEFEGSGTKKNIPEEALEKNAAIENEVGKSPEMLEELVDSDTKKRIPEEEAREKNKTAAIESDRKIEELNVSGTKKHIPEEAPEKNAAIESGVSKSQEMIEEFEDSGTKKHIPEEAPEKNAAIEREVRKSTEMLREDSGTKKHFPEEEERERTKTAAIESEVRNSPERTNKLEDSETKQPKEPETPNAAVQNANNLTEEEQSEKMPTETLILKAIETELISSEETTAEESVSLDKENVANDDDQKKCDEGSPESSDAKGLILETENDKISDPNNMDTEDISGEEKEKPCENIEEPRSSTKRSSDRKSIVVHENIKAGEDKACLIDRLHKVVDVFCSGIKNTSDLSVNVSCDYSVCSSDSENGSQSAVAISFSTSEGADHKGSKRRKLYHQYESSDLVNRSTNSERKDEDELEEENEDGSSCSEDYSSSKLYDEEDNDVDTTWQPDEEDGASSSELSTDDSLDEGVSQKEEEKEKQKSEEGRVKRSRRNTKPVQEKEDGGEGGPEESNEISWFSNLAQMIDEHVSDAEDTTWLPNDDESDLSELSTDDSLDGDATEDVSQKEEEKKEQKSEERRVKRSRRNTKPVEEKEDGDGEGAEDAHVSDAEDTTWLPNEDEPDVSELSTDDSVDEETEQKVEEPVEKTPEKNQDDAEDSDESSDDSCSLSHIMSTNTSDEDVFADDAMGDVEVLSPKKEERMAKVNSKSTTEHKPKSEKDRKRKLFRLSMYNVSEVLEEYQEEPEEHKVKSKKKQEISEDASPLKKKKKKQELSEDASPLKMKKKKQHGGGFSESAADEKILPATSEVPLKEKRKKHVGDGTKRKRAKIGGVGGQAGFLKPSTSGSSGWDVKTVPSSS